MKNFEAKLKKMAQVNPTKSFSKDAKLRLLSKIEKQNDEAWFLSFLTRVEIPYPSSRLKASFLERLFGGRPFWGQGFWEFFQVHKLFAAFGVLAIVTATTFSFFTFTNTTSAEEQTLLTVVNGLVEIGTNDDFRQSQVGAVLSTNSVVRTGENSSAEIVFFEDSVIRLAENTQVKIEKLAPNPLDQEVGNVVVSFDFGKVWVKTLVEETEIASFELRAGDELAVFPQRGTFDLIREGNITTLRVFDRSIKVSYRGSDDPQSLNLLEENKLKISLKGIGEPVDIDMNEYSDYWIESNLRSDQQYVAEFISQKTAKSTDWNSINEVINNLEPDSAEQYLLVAKKNFNEGLEYLANNQEDLAAQKFTAFADYLHDSLVKDEVFREKALILIEKEAKHLQLILPDDQLFPAKEALNAAREIVAEDPLIAIQQGAKEKLWEANELAKTATPQSQNLAKRSLDEYSNAIKKAPSNTADPELRAEILDQKSEELEILSEIEENIEAKPETQEKIAEIETEVVNEALEASSRREPLRPGFPTLGAEEDKIDDLVAQVNIYKTERGQENATREVLKQFENDISQLSDLKELKAKLPEKVRPMVTKKMVETIREEKKNAQSES
jgi:hypothetical protein